MENWLKLKIEKDSDGTCELFASIQAGGFSGHSSAWFDLTEIDRFARALQQFPLPAANRPSLRGGFWSKESPASLDQEHLFIEAYPVGLTGTIGMRVRLSSEIWEHDRPDSLMQVSAELLTTYEELGQFSAQILRLAAGSATEALLKPRPA